MNAQCLDEWVDGGKYIHWLGKKIGVCLEVRDITGIMIVKIHV
jgi:hypothetical protein